MILKYHLHRLEKVKDREPILEVRQHRLFSNLMSNFLLQLFAFYHLSSHLYIEAVPNLNLIVLIRIIFSRKDKN